MSYRLPPLPWLRAFEASARRGSFAAAADELGLTSAAVSHQMRSLEQELGYPLFERLARGLRLTDLGKAYLVPVRQAFSELSISTLSIFGPEGETVLNVRVPVSFAVLWMTPRLARFATAHPGIRLRLFSAIWADALPADKADVDIRFGYGNWPGSSAQILVNDPIVLVTVPNSRIRSVRDIGSNEMIQIMGVESDWLHLFEAEGMELPKGGAGISVDTSLAALEIVASGHGAALVLSRFAAAFEATGRVKRVPGIELPHDQSHYLLNPQNSEAPRAEALLFTDWLRQELAAEAAATSTSENPPRSHAGTGRRRRNHGK
ncbi:LysR family transcriptional regulator [Dongia sp.]|uniref:LysR family transcriptional regulator n=1 Tax=Dongia sp. TaxID=1977262 RepID=UPI0035B292D3